MKPVLRDLDQLTREVEGIITHPIHPIAGSVLRVAGVPSYREEYDRILSEEIAVRGEHFPDDEESIERLTALQDKLWGHEEG